MSKKKDKSAPKQVSKKAISKEEMKAIYMESPHLAWQTFCQEQGVDPLKSKSEYPSALWRAEKRQKIINAERERLKDMVVENMGAWIGDVKTTIQKYPQVADAALGLIAQKIQSMNEMAREKKMHLVDTQQLATLAQAINTITQAKHRALMIDQFNVDLTAMMDSASQVPEDETKTEGPRQLEVVIKHTGQTNYKDDQHAEDRFSDYYDWNNKSDQVSNASLVAQAILPPEVKDMIKAEDAADEDEINKLLKEAENL